MNSLDQITVKHLKNGIQLNLNMPAFKRPKKYAKIKNDTLILNDKTSRNLFHLYGDGLGINAEVLNNFDYKFIECNFEGHLLRTTREHFKKKGIPSHYISDKVDPQFILRLIDWTIPNDDKSEIPYLIKNIPISTDQLSLFGEVA